MYEGHQLDGYDLELFPLLAIDASLALATFGGFPTLKTVPYGFLSHFPPLPLTCTLATLP